MATLGLDNAPHFSGILLFPVRHHVIAGFDFEKAFEDERKALGGGFLEGQNLDVIIVHAEMATVAFDRRLGKVVIEEGVVFEFGEFQLVGMEIERSFENAEGFLFVERRDRNEVADLKDEATGLLHECRLGIFEVLPENDRLLLTRKMCPQIRENFFRIPRKLGEGLFELGRGLKSLMQHHVIDRKGKQRVGLAAQVGNAVLDRGVYDGVGVKLVGDGFVVALEEVLVDSVAFIEQLQSGFKALRETVKRSAVETLVVHSANFEDDAHLAGLGEKNVRANEAIQIDLLAE